MATAIATVQRPSLATTFAGKYGIKADSVFSLLKETALKSKDPVTDAEVAAFMVICNEYDLNPFIKEIFGFISKGKMQYVISVDGWSTLVNRQKELNGIEFEEHFNGDNIRSITCKIHRKDRALPTVITEYFSECYRSDAEPWKKWPIRMLRHKSLIQCSRIAFGLAGLMDEDEAERLPGFVSTQAPVLEGNRQADPEIDAYMNALGWNETQKRVSRSNFAGNRDGHLEYVRGEAAKAGIKIERPGPQTITAQAQPQAEEQITEGDTGSSETEQQTSGSENPTGTMAAASTSAPASAGAKPAKSGKAPNW